MESDPKKLISIASPALCEPPPVLPRELLTETGLLGEHLLELLRQKNGFYAFEGALHVFPAGCRIGIMDVESWNKDDLWRKGYGDLLNGYLFFAEDVFGGQYGIYSSRIFKVDPESAESEEVAEDIDEWAAIILSDYNFHLGYSLAHEWQTTYGSLPEGKRLLPKIPFVLGGAYEIGNLYAGDALKGMQFRADMWRQIRDLPDGAQIELRTVE